MAFAIREQAKQIKGDEVPLETLVSTFHHDMRLSAEVEGKLESYKTLQAQILLLGGSNSKADMKSALNR